jgi:hypothetical protein
MCRQCTNTCCAACAATLLLQKPAAIVHSRGLQRQSCLMNDSIILQTSAVHAHTHRRPCWQPTLLQPLAHVAPAKQDRLPATLHFHTNIHTVHTNRRPRHVQVPRHVQAQHDCSACFAKQRLPDTQSTPECTACCFNLQATSQATSQADPKAYRSAAGTLAQQLSAGVPGCCRQDGD